MKVANFIYRQKQKIKYHTADNDTEKRIAEINRFKEMVVVKSNTYLIPEADLEIPKELFDFIFIRFDLFINNRANLNGRYLVEKGRLFFEFDDTKIWINSVSEIFVINEIYFGQCYNLITPSDIKYIVLDIGMNVGLSSLFFAKKESIEKVYGFEPFKPTFDNAIVNFSLNKRLSSKIIPLNKGLGFKTEELELPYNPENSGINKTLNSDAKSTSGSFEKLYIESALQTFETISKKESGKNFILKIDCEGAEYDIIKSLNQTEIPKSIKIILMEWHEKGSKVLEEILIKNGFALISTVLGKSTGLIYAIR